MQNAGNAECRIKENGKLKIKVFVDGSEGTTGLQINERLNKHTQVEVLTIESDLRKDTKRRKELINSADVAILCLPDVASIEAVSLVENEKTKIIDASTAFRTDENWAYGLPEINKALREKIAGSKRIAVPGCHATGFTSAVYPLIAGGILPKDYPLSCQSVTGYSGGGKSLIARFENEENKEALRSPQFYALGLAHKHLPEMKAVNGLDFNPLFTPVVCNYYNGMSVAIPLHTRLFNKKMSAKEMQEYLADYYKDEHFIRVMPFESESYLENGFLSATKCNGTNFLELCVFGHSEQIVLVSRLDNLGKGASGAAVQCLNISFGLNETEGL